MLDKLLPFIFIFSALCGCPFLQQNEVKQATKIEFKKQTESVNCSNDSRLEDVRRLFKGVGATQSEIETKTFDNVKNIVVSLKGNSKETIIVGAHYDKTTLGCGAIDNWTGVVLLANLYRTLKSKRRSKSYKFVAFGKEEKGLIGSRAMARSMSENEKNNSCAMINFDSFGFDNMWALQSISDRSLIEVGKEIAESRKQRFDIKNFRGASSDSKAFQEQGIPAITLSGLGNDWRDYLHQKGDQLKNVDTNMVYKNYLFALDYLNKIDSSKCQSFR